MEIMMMHYRVKFKSMLYKFLLGGDDIQEVNGTVRIIIVILIVACIIQIR